MHRRFLSQATQQQDCYTSELVLRRRQVKGHRGRRGRQCQEQCSSGSSCWLQDGVEDGGEALVEDGVSCWVRDDGEDVSGTSSAAGFGTTVRRCRDDVGCQIDGEPHPYYRRGADAMRKAREHE
jgi:hypothetical protein